MLRDQSRELVRQRSAVKQFHNFLVAHRLEVLVELAHGVKEARRQQTNNIGAPMPDLA
jgi:hypothetical protein